jgi:hypothetical protein
MPTLLLSFKRNSDSEILIHGTLAPNEARSETMMKEHANICPKFGPARKAEETIEVAIDVDDIPAFDEDEIQAWVDDLFDLETEEEEEDEDVGDEGEEEEDS